MRRDAVLGLLCMLATMLTGAPAPGRVVLAASPRPVAISGSSALAAEPAAARVRRPPASADAVPLRTAADEIVLWAWDFQRLQYYRVRAANVYQSAAAWIYVETGQPVPRETVVELGRRFDQIIYPTLRERMGRDPHPGIDDQVAITIVLLDIRDPLYYDVAPYTYYSGYFDPLNERRQSDLARESPYARSNEREMIYLDVAPTEPAFLAVGQTAAHEFSHLIQWGYDPNDAEWMVEGLAELAVSLCGLGHPEEHVRAFLAAPGGSLTAWHGTIADYGRVYLFMLYVHEQATAVDAAWLRRLVRNPDDGLRSIGTAFPTGRSPEELWHDFATALFLDDPSGAGGRFAIRGIALSDGGEPGAFPLPAATAHDPFPSHHELDLAPWSLRADRFYGLAGALDLKLTATARVCATATWLRTGLSEVGGADVARSECLVPGRPVVWSLRRAGATDLVLVSANPGDEPVLFEFDVLPDVVVESYAWAVYLPVIVDS